MTSKSTRSPVTRDVWRWPAMREETLPTNPPIPTSMTSPQSLQDERVGEDGEGDGKRLLGVRSSVGGMEEFQKFLGTAFEGAAGSARKAKTKGAAAMVAMECEMKKMVGNMRKRTGVGVRRAPPSDDLQARPEAAPGLAKGIAVGEMLKGERDVPATELYYNKLRAQTGVDLRSARR